MLMNVISNRLGVGGSIPLQPCKTDLIAWNDFTKYYEREDEAYCIDDKMGTREDVPRTGQCLQGDQVGFVNLGTPVITSNVFSIMTDVILPFENIRQCIISQYDATSEFRMTFLANHPTLSKSQFYLNSSVENIILNGSDLRDGAKHRVCVVSDGFMTYLIEDGVVVDSANFSYTPLQEEANILRQGTTYHSTHKQANLIITNNNIITNQYNLNNESGSIAYDSIGTANGTLTGFDLTTPGSTAYPWKEDNRFTNVANDEGYTLDGAVVKPVMPNGLDVDGNIPTNPGRVKRGVEVLTTAGGDGTLDPTGIDTSLLFFRYPDIPAFQVMNKLDTAVYGTNFSGTLEADKFTWTPAELLNLPNTLQGVYHQQVWVKTPLISPLKASLVYGSPLVVDSSCYNKTVKYTGSAQWNDSKVWDDTKTWEE